MLNLDKQTLHSSPSLLALRTALLAAATDVPARPIHADRNELLAQTLINRMRTEFRKPLPSAAGREAVPFPDFRLQEVIGEHA